MPCGVIIVPLPMLASTLPERRSNLNTGSTGLFSQSTGPPPAVPAPQRSYPQTWPSFGSMSRPALVPHFRPAGSSPQFLVTIGVGFGNPTPLMGLPAVADRPLCSADDDFAAMPVVHAANRSAAQAPNAGIRIRGFDMTPPRRRGR